MSISTFILGESGTGKSTSLRNLKSEEVLLIQAVKKPLPFRSKWSIVTKENPQGNIYQQDDADSICHAMTKTSKDIIVIDDFQYVMSNEFMRRSNERGYDKFTDIGKNAWNIVTMAANLPAHKRVYILSHTESTELGKIKAKTIGKMLDDKITLEGMFTIVLRSQIINEQYVFSTKNNGNDTCKTPMGMFDELYIENDLAAVDKAVKEYYELAKAA
jgi:predicted ATP-dependent serine protease